MDLPQIPEFARKTRKLINDIQLYDADGESLKEISTGVARVLQVLDDKYIMLSDTLTKLRLDRLEKEDREVSLLNERLTQWKTTLDESFNDGQIKDSTASAMTRVWQITLDTINAVQKPEAMKKPGPYLNLKGIGTSAMEINLYCWIKDTDKIFSSGTAIRKTVYKALVDAGYDIPVPKQDLEISSSQQTEQE